MASQAVFEEVELQELGSHRGATEGEVVSSATEESFDGDEEQKRQNATRREIERQLATQLKQENLLAQEVDPQRQKGLRLLFCLAFLGFCLYRAAFTEQVAVLSEGVCLRDRTFEWTERINAYMRKDLDFKNLYIIFASLLMDVQMLGFWINYVMEWKTQRAYLAYLFFFVCRLGIQKTFFMGRPDGFLWSYPGVIAITVPYPDINDFFYSGHVGTCVLMVLEYRAMRWYKMSNFSLFVCANQWILMTFVRTHFITDMIAGAVVAHYFFMLAEWTSYFFDTLLFGVTHHRRGRLNYAPCHSCGWHNQHPADRTTKKEYENLIACDSKGRLRPSWLHQVSCFRKIEGKAAAEVRIQISSSSNQEELESENAK